MICRCLGISVRRFVGHCSVLMVVFNRHSARSFRIKSEISSVDRLIEVWRESLFAFTKSNKEPVAARQANNETVTVQEKHEQRS